MSASIPMPFNGKDVPHLVIEVNQACNMSCRACYKARASYTKPFRQIIEEVDFAITQRNLDMITLAGGEPTLHPRLPEVISYIDGKGVKVSLLTNGLLLTDELLAEYKAAGLTRAMVHVDADQRRPDATEGATETELNELRRTILERVARHGLRGGLAMTLYRRSLHEFPDLLEFLFSTPQASLLLVTCCRSFAPIAQKHGAEGCIAAMEDSELVKDEVTTAEVIEVVEKRLGIMPTHHIPSSHRETERRWIFYLVFSIIDRDGNVTHMYLDPKFKRTIAVANGLQKLAKGRYKFDMVPKPFEAVMVCLGYAILGMSLGTLWRTLRFLWRLWRPGTRIQSKVVVVQQLPNLTEEGEIEYCENCPDATVREGEIVQLCMADILRPVREG